MVVIDNISKSYGTVKALQNIRLNVRKGELFGLIGRDGAGNSTLFDILVTLLKADMGAATVDGLNVKTDHKQIRDIIGYMPGKFSLYQDLSVRENLDFFATIFDTTVEENLDIINDIWVQIEPFSTRPAGKLSGGMKQKLALCCALVHKPKVLFLDEPTTGVDPVSRREFWEMLKSLNKREITIVVSTPYMDEAVMCDRVALIQDGIIMKVDTPKNIMDNYPRPLYEVKSKNLHSDIVKLRQKEGVHSCYPFGQTAHLALKHDASLEAIAKDLTITYKQIEAGIEDCFMDLMTSDNN